MAITGNIYISGASIALIGGMYWKRASITGAFAAIVSGLFSVCGVFLEPIQNLIPQITPALLGISNFVVCAVVFIVFSLLFPDTQRVDVKEST